MNSTTRKARVRMLCCLAAVAVIVSLLTGCGEKKVISTGDFETAALQRSYIVQDATDYFEAYDYIKTATIAAPQDKSFQLEFYELNDSAVAKSFYDSNKNNFIMMKSGDCIESDNSGSNFDVYTLEMFNKFMMIERVDNTVIYVNSTDSSNRSAIENFVKELKY